MQNANQIIMLLLLISNLSFGQQLHTSGVSVGGNTVSTENIILDYTIGESFVATKTNGKIVTEGIHQPLISTLQLKLNRQHYTVTYFPNPSRDYLFVTFEELTTQKVEFELFDIRGKQINAPIYGNDNKYTIDLRNLLQGSYIINFAVDGSSTKESVLKVIKH